MNNLKNGSINDSYLSLNNEKYTKSDNAKTPSKSLAIMGTLRANRNLVCLLSFQLKLVALAKFALTRNNYDIVAKR